MAQFQYIRPHTLSEALALLAGDGCLPLAGGTDLMVRLRRGETPPQARLVDIGRLAELKEIRPDGNRMRIGAAVTYREAIHCGPLAQAAPFLIEACRQVGGPQIRNRGTLGGNICNAAACADTLPVLVALDACLELRSQEATRLAPLDDFVLGSGKVDLRPGELLTAILFRQLPAGARTAFYKLGRRSAVAISRLTLAAVGKLDGEGRVECVRLAPGAVGQRVQRFPQMEAMILGERPTPERLAAAAEFLAAEVLAQNGARWSSEYKGPVLARLAGRMLAQVLAPQDC